MAERKRRRRLAMDKEKKLEQMVLKTYYDFSNPGSYGGLARLQKATGVPLKKLKAIMRKNLIYALHKPVRVNYGTNPTVANSIDHQWAADLADMKNLSKYNKGIKYLLTVVDVLNKYAWVVPMKNKTGAEQKRAFESILQEGRKPLGLQTDKGSEFFNKPFQEYLKERKINHFNTESDTKASVVERFNRMLKHPRNTEADTNSRVSSQWNISEIPWTTSNLWVMCNIYGLWQVGRGLDSTPKAHRPIPIT